MFRLGPRPRSWRRALRKWRKTSPRQNCSKNRCLLVANNYTARRCWCLKTFSRTFLTSTHMLRWRRETWTCWKPSCADSLSQWRRARMNKHGSTSRIRMKKSRFLRPSGIWMPWSRCSACETSSHFRWLNWVNGSTTSPRTHSARFSTTSAQCPCLSETSHPSGQQISWSSLSRAEPPTWISPRARKTRSYSCSTSLDWSSFWRRRNQQSWASWAASWRKRPKNWSPTARSLAFRSNPGRPPTKRRERKLTTSEWSKRNGRKKNSKRKWTSELN